MATVIRRIVNLDGLTPTPAAFIVGTHVGQAQWETTSLGILVNDPVKVCWWVAEPVPVAAKVKCTLGDDAESHPRFQKFA
jgi:hypothetical protein